MTDPTPDLAASGETFDRLPDDGLDDAIAYGDESWFWPEGSEVASTLDVLRDLRATRAEVERLSAALDRAVVDLAGAKTARYAAYVDAERAEAALADLRAKVADLYIEDDGNSYPTLWQRNDRHPIALVSNADIDHRVWALIVAALAAAPSGEPRERCGERIPALLPHFATDKSHPEHVCGLKPEHDGPHHCYSNDRTWPFVAAPSGEPARMLDGSDGRFTRQHLDNCAVREGRRCDQDCKSRIDPATGREIPAAPSGEQRKEGQR